MDEGYRTPECLPRKLERPADISFFLSQRKKIANAIIPQRRQWSKNLPGKEFISESDHPFSLSLAPLKG